MAKGVRRDGTKDGDTLTGSELDDQLLGDGGDDRLDGWRGRDELQGGWGNDTLYGGSGHDVLFGDAGDDRLVGDKGNDWIDGGAGSDILDGGEGVDWAVYESAIWSVSVDLSLTGPQIVFEGYEADTLINIERVFGSRYHDSLAGGDKDDLLRGGSGNDRLEGRQGDDALVGDDGDDSLNGGSGADYLEGGPGHDRYFIDDARATAIELNDEGDDTVQTSVDWVLRENFEYLILVGVYAVVGEGNSVSNVILGNDADNRLKGWGGDDSIYGGEGGDFLEGGFGDDRLLGDFGNDTLRGGAGDDTIIGGAGTDLLTGAAGADFFIFDDWSDSPSLAPDRIKDFDWYNDRIYLTGIDADPTAAGNQSFTLVERFTGRPGELVVSYNERRDVTTVRIDGDGDGRAEFAIAIDGQVWAPDFFLVL